MANDIQHERELREQWQKFHNRLHELESEALRIARGEVDRRLAEMNQFRDQIERERGEFLSRDMYEEKHDALKREFDGRLKTLETGKSNLEGKMWAMGAAISAIAVGLNLLLHYIK